MPGLTINGASCAFADSDFPATLAEVVRMRGLSGKALVAEVNGEIVPGDDFAGHALADGDTIELVQFVGGG